MATADSVVTALDSAAVVERVAEGGPGWASVVERAAAATPKDCQDSVEVAKAAQGSEVDLREVMRGQTRGENRVQRNAIGLKWRVYLL